MAAAGLTGGVPSRRHLVVSGFGDDTGGGLYRVEPATGAVERVDDLATTGMWVGPGLDRLVRVLRVPAEVSGPCELLDHDAGGLRAYRRLDELTDPHDVLVLPGPGGDTFVITSSDRNSVTWVDADGRVAREWRPTAVPDAWHVNCLLPHDGQLLVAAFGRFAGSREWSGDAARGAGFLAELADAGTGRAVVTGLTHPHTPRRIDGEWVICESLLGEVAAFDESGRATRRVALGGYPRGLAVDGDALHVGVSGRRDGDPPYAAIVTLDRRTWDVRHRVELDCREVYDLVLVGDELLAGLRRGCHTNPARVQGPALRCDPLPPEACAVTVEVGPVPPLEAGGFAEVPCRVRNRGTDALVSAPPHPIHLAYRWHVEGTDGAHTEGHRTVLRRDLRPGEVLAVPLRLGAPPAPGSYRLVVSAVQEGVRWFDEVDAANRWEAAVDVRLPGGATNPA